MLMQFSLQFASNTSTISNAQLANARSEEMHELSMKRSESNGKSSTTIKTTRKDIKSNQKECNENENKIFINNNA